MKHPLFITSSTEKKLRDALLGFKNEIDQKIRFGNESKKLILLKGPPGTGKSYTLSIITGELGLIPYIKRYDQNILGKKPIFMLDTDNFLDIISAIEQNYNFYIIESRTISTLNRTNINTEFIIQFLPLSLSRFRKSLKQLYEYSSMRSQEKSLKKEKQLLGHDKKSLSRTKTQQDTLTSLKRESTNIFPISNETNQNHENKSHLRRSKNFGTKLHTMLPAEVQRNFTTPYDPHVLHSINLHTTLPAEVQRNLPTPYNPHVLHSINRITDDQYKIILDSILEIDKNINLNHFEYLKIPNFYTAQYLYDRSTSFFHFLGKIFYSKVPANISIDYERVLNYIFTNYLKFINFRKEKPKNIHPDGHLKSRYPKTKNTNLLPAKKTQSELKQIIIQDSLRRSQISNKKSHLKKPDHQKKEEMLDFFLNDHDEPEDMNTFRSKKQEMCNFLANNRKNVEISNDRSTKAEIPDVKKLDSQPLNVKKLDSQPLNVKKLDAQSLNVKKLDSQPLNVKKVHARPSNVDITDAEIPHLKRRKRKSINVSVETNYDASSKCTELEYEELSIADIDINSLMSDEVFNEPSIPPVQNLRSENSDHIDQRLLSLAGCYDFAEQISFSSFINREELVLVYVNQRNNQKSFVQFNSPEETRFNYNKKWKFKDIS